MAVFLSYLQRACVFLRSSGLSTEDRQVFQEANRHLAETFLPTDIVLELLSSIVYLGAVLTAYHTPCEDLPKKDCASLGKVALQPFHARNCALFLFMLVCFQLFRNYTNTCITVAIAARFGQPIFSNDLRSCLYFGFSSRQYTSEISAGRQESRLYERLSSSSLFVEENNLYRHAEYMRSTIILLFVCSAMRLGYLINSKNITRLNVLSVQLPVNVVLVGFWTLASFPIFFTWYLCFFQKQKVCSAVAAALHPARVPLPQVPARLALPQVFTSGLANEE